MQGSGDLFIILLVCRIKKLYFFMNIGSEVLVGMWFSLPFQPYSLMPIGSKTP